jgi:hypothetical protein
MLGGDTWCDIFLASPGDIGDGSGIPVLGLQVKIIFFTLVSATGMAWQKSPVS